MERIILASESPRRQALLSQAGIEYTVMPSYIDEDAVMGEEFSPYDMVKILSSKKAMHVCDQLANNALIIAADTIVALKGRIMGKPKDAEEARQMLQFLQGKLHSVYTGVTIIRKEEDGLSLKYIVDNTSVRMRALAEAEIQAYIDTGEPFGKAGAYAIQERGSLLIESIEGDYNTVVGLPLVKVCLALQGFGMPLTSLWKK